MLITLIWRYARATPLMGLVAVLLMALGGAAWLLSLQVERGLEHRVAIDARGIDLVVGAKGSPLQLVLAGVYHLDTAPGNVPLQEFERLERHPQVKAVWPLALGDNLRGFRIVGADARMASELYGATLAQGQMYTAAMQAVIGAEVAKRLGLWVGDRFEGAHGLSPGGPVHEGAFYTITGVLAATGTVLDRLLLTPLESVWLVHEGTPADEMERQALEEARELTLMLLQYRSPLAAALLPRQINASPVLQAASPAAEVARLFVLFEPAFQLLRAGALVLGLLAGLALFAALMGLLDRRARDYAGLRAIGLAQGAVAVLVLGEALLLTAAGLLLALLLAALAWLGMTLWLDAGLPMTLWPEPWALLVLLLGGVLLSLLSAAWPAWRASHADPMDLLNQP
jgi:putative ABC transport system permease protein